MSTIAQSPVEDSVNWYQGKFVRYFLETSVKDSALYFTKQYLEFAERKELHKDYLLAHQLMFRIHNRYREYALAKQYAFDTYDLAKQLIQEGKLSVEDPLNFYSINNLGVYFSDQFSYKQAEKYYALAMQSVQQIKDPSNRLTSLFQGNMNLGTASTLAGDYEQAKQYYEQNLRLVAELDMDSVKQEVDFYDKIFSCHLRLAEVYEYERQYELAESQYQKALTFMKANPSIRRTRALIHLHESLAGIQYLKKEYKKAKGNLALVKDFQDEYKRNNKEFYFLEGMLFLEAKILRETGEYEMSESKFQKAYQLMRSRYDSLDLLIANLHDEFGTLYGKQGKHEKALAQYQKGLICYVDSGTFKSFDQIPTQSAFKTKTKELISLLHHYAQALESAATEQQDLAILQTAHQSYQLLASLIEDMRDTYQYDASRIFWGEIAKPIFEDAIELALKLAALGQENHYKEAAFYLAERSKAAVLYAAIKEQEARELTVIPKEQLDKEQSLRESMNFYQTLIQTAGSEDSSLLASWKNELFALEREHQQYIQELETSYPAYRRLKFQHQQASIADLQSRLQQDKVTLIEFVEASDAYYVFVISPNAFEVHLVDWGTEQQSHLDILLNQLYEQVAMTQDIHPLESAAIQVYEDLLGPLPKRSFDQRERLLIVPDGSLAYLPFDVLIDPDLVPHESAPHIPPYLLNQFAIRYSYSSQIWLGKEQEKKRMAKVLGVAPSYTGALQLLYTEQEVQAITDIFTGRTLSGKSASETAFKAHARSYPILHVAAHGFPDHDQPLKSRLALLADSLNDGSLYAYELFNMDIPAELVVLSACHTGYGPELKGEGVQSLTRAFSYAGSRSVLMSLWEAQGAVAAELMPIFYSHMKQGMSKDEALRAAKLQYLREGHTMLLHPRYWANFTLWGDSFPMQTSGLSSWSLLWGLLAMIGLVGLYMIVKRRSIDRVGVDRNSNHPS